MFSLSASTQKPILIFWQAKMNWWPSMVEKKEHFQILPLQMLDGTSYQPQPAWNLDDGNYSPPNGWQAQVPRSSKSYYQRERRTHTLGETTEIGQWQHSQLSRQVTPLQMTSTRLSQLSCLLFTCDRQKKTTPCFVCRCSAQRRFSGSFQAKIQP